MQGELVLPIDSPRAAIKAVGKLVLAYCVVALALHYVGSVYAHALLPVVRTALELVHPRLAVQSASIQSDVVQFVVLLHDHALKATVAIPVSQLLVCPLVVLTLVVGWPRQGARDRLLALAIAAPLVVLVAALDTPHVIAATLADKAAAQGAPKSLLSFWWFLLDNGGRQVMAVLVAWAAIDGARRCNMGTASNDHEPRIPIPQGQTAAISRRIVTPVRRLPVTPRAFRMRLHLPVTAASVSCDALLPSSAVTPWANPFLQRQPGPRRDGLPRRIVRMSVLHPRRAKACTFAAQALPALVVRLSERHSME